MKNVQFDLYNENSFTGTAASLYWNASQGTIQYLAGHLTGSIPNPRYWVLCLILSIILKFNKLWQVLSSKTIAKSVCAEIGVMIFLQISLKFDSWFVSFPSKLPAKFQATTKRFMFRFSELLWSFAGPIRTTANIFICKPWDHFTNYFSFIIQIQCKLYNIQL